MLIQGRCTKSYNLLRKTPYLQKAIQKIVKGESPFNEL